jgi:hypothetical protein
MTVPRCTVAIIPAGGAIALFLARVRTRYGFVPDRFLCPLPSLYCVYWWQRRGNELVARRSGKRSAVTVGFRRAKSLGAHELVPHPLERQQSASLGRTHGLTQEPI